MVAVNTTDRQSLPVIEKAAIADHLNLVFDASGKPIGMLPVADMGSSLQEEHHSADHKMGEFPVSMGLPVVKVGEPEKVEQSSGFGNTPFHCSFYVKNFTDIEWVEITVADRRPDQRARFHTQKFTINQILSGGHGWALENPNFHGVKILHKVVNMSGGTYDFDIAYRLTGNSIAFVVEDVHNTPNTYGFVREIKIKAPLPSALPTLTLERPPPPLDVQLLDRIETGNPRQTELQEMYDSVTGGNAPDDVPQEVKDASANSGLSGYRLYLGQNTWWYSNDATGASWSKFGSGSKANFDAAVVAVWTMK